MRGPVDKRAVLRRLTITGFIGFTLVIVAVFVRQDRISAAASVYVERAYEERNQIQSVFNRIRDIELGQRGYALSGDSSYLAPYFEALYGNTKRTRGDVSETVHGNTNSTLWDELRRLLEYFQDNPDQLARARLVEKLAHERVQFAESVIRARSQNRMEALHELVLSGEGKRIMDSTRNVVDDMMKQQVTRLRDKRAQESSNLRLNSSMLYVVVALFYLAWLLSLRVASRSRRSRLTAERELKASHSLLQAVIDSSTRGLFTTGLDGRIRIFNPAAERILGYSASEVVGQKASEVLRGIHEPAEIERRRQQLVEKLGRPVRGLEIFQLSRDSTGMADPSWTLVRKNGSTLLAALTISPLVGRDGGQYGHLIMFQDVTERRMLLRRLAESNAMFQAVLDGAHYAIFATDAAGRLTIFNAAAEAMLGMKAKHAIGKDVMDLLTDLKPEEVEARRARVYRAYGRYPEGIELFTLPLEDDRTLGQEWTFKNDVTGHEIPLMLSVSEMKDERGRVIGYVALARDITELRANEKLKKEFISTVSHELRTPLTSIRGALGLVAGGAAGQLPDGVRDMLAIAHRNSERLVRIINDILDIDKIDSGNLTLYPKVIEAGSFLVQAIEANMPYGTKHSVRFVPGDIPAARIEVDPDRLMQVMSNLLSNAAKFSRPGSDVHVGARVREGTYRIYVQDQGTGIPEEFRSRIFSKFAQAEGMDSRRFEGTGLGLHITRKLVEAMGGAIDFETEAGKGTTFFFDVPLAKQGEALPSGTGDAAQGHAPAGTTPGAGEAPRILICEDDPDVGTLLRVLLERAGLQTRLARTLEEARDMLKAGDFAAMTLDLGLPDGSGLTLLRELRHNPETRTLPVIVVSARADEGRKDLTGDAIGMIDWVTKPIDEDRLQQALGHALMRMDAGTGEEKPRVLHIEDDADFRHVLESSLGDAAEWTGAATLSEAETYLAQGRYHLVVLDLDLPDGSGLVLLERLKNHPGGPVPVLILSASETDNSVRDQVEAVLVKSRLSEERLVDTILAQIRKVKPSASATPGSSAP